MLNDRVDALNNVEHPVLVVYAKLEDSKKMYQVMCCEPDVAMTTFYDSAMLQSCTSTSLTHGRTGYLLRVVIHYLFPIPPFTNFPVAPNPFTQLTLTKTIPARIQKSADFFTGVGS